MHSSDGLAANDSNQHPSPIQSSPAFRVSLQSSKTSTDRASTGMEPIRGSGMTACNQVC